MNNCFTRLNIFIIYASELELTILLFQIGFTMADKNNNDEKKKKNPPPVARTVRRKKKKGPANVVKIPVGVFYNLLHLV